MNFWQILLEVTPYLYPKKFNNVFNKLLILSWGRLPCYLKLYYESCTNFKVCLAKEVCSFGEYNE